MGLILLEVWLSMVDLKVSRIFDLGVDIVN